MKEHPIIFNAEMIRAILDGRKTQTRRVVNFPKVWADMVTHDDLEVSGFWNACQDDEGYHRWQYGDEYLLRQNYQTGDRLWVRETWGVGAGAGPPVLYRVDSGRLADGEKWKPSIHMPRWASRINLIVTDVRVERVQEISEADAEAEGCPGWYQPMHPDAGSTDGRLPTEQFAELWDSINEKRGFGWDKNPWVWVIEFEKGA